MKKIHIGCMGCVCVAHAAWGAPRNSAPAASAQINRVIIHSRPVHTGPKLKMETYL